MIESKFSRREVVKKPTCPFCGMLIERPRELTTRMPGEMPVGSCSCGAVYACDETGHNLGSAMIEALVFGCNMDWDLAWSLLPGDDYLEETVKNYDFISHLVVPTGFYESRRIAGALFFIKLHEDVREVTSDGVRKKLEKAAAVSPATAPPPGRTAQGSLSKKEVEDLVREFRVDSIVNVAPEDRKIIRNLQRLLYSGDDLFRQQAAEILGRAAAVIAERDPGAISKLLQRLFTSITDTAAFTWGAFEAIGEIISHKPEMFAGYTPQLYQFLADDTKRIQALQAMGRIARSSPDLIRKIISPLVSFLYDPDPSVRGYTVWTLGKLKASEARADLESLREDSCTVGIYRDGEVEKKTVGELASEALEKF
ncbi:MAG: DVU0298 family protein [Syntrophobacteria bacterium]